MRSYSSRVLMCACARKCSGGSNRRCSCRTESMLVSEAGIETFSAILVPREAVDWAMLSRTEFYSGEGVLVCHCEIPAKNKDRSQTALYMSRNLRRSFSGGIGQESYFPKVRYRFRAIRLQPQFRNHR